MSEQPWRVVGPFDPARFDPAEPLPAPSNTPRPSHSLVDGGNEGRLIWPLRAAAQSSVGTMLALGAATSVLRAQVATFPTTSPPFPPRCEPARLLKAALSMVPPAERDALADAFADLAVTGRRARDEYRSLAHTPAEIVPLATNFVGAVAQPVDAAKVAAAVQRALDRANAVHDMLSSADRKRHGMGYIAVSSEDDAPWRPVNLSALASPHEDIEVAMALPDGSIVDVHARYTLATEENDGVLHDDHHVLLFLHGDGSRVEEVTPLLPSLWKKRALGRRYAVLAVDLPTHGYTTMLDAIGAFDAQTPPWFSYDPCPRPASYPVLEFLEKFVVNFVSKLDAALGNRLVPRLLGPMGGSLGGNLSLRLARRSEAWIRQSISWSPASVWASLADDGLKALAPSVCSENGHLFENEPTRRTFFHDVFDASTSFFGVQIVSPQGDYWYRDGWDGKKTLLAAAREERTELYNACYRRWHFRMDREQLLYSFADADTLHGPKRSQTFRSRLLLCAGEADDASPTTQIYSSVIALAQDMAGTRGRVVLFGNTGHSIHDERPNALARQIDSFVAETLGTPVVTLYDGPGIRFTGSVHELGCPLKATSGAGRKVMQLLVTFRTGSDDLRGGASGKDDCDVTLHTGPAGDPVQTIANVNRSRGWGGQSTHTVPLFLEVDTQVEDLTRLTVSTTFGGGLGGDNWDLVHVTVTAVLA